MSASFTMPHWSDPRVGAVALAIYDDTSLHTALPFPREDAVKYWPGLDARRFVAMTAALTSAAARQQSPEKEPGT